MLIGVQNLATGGGAGATASSLLNGLRVYYKLEDLTDSSGNALTLTDHGTVTFGAGQVNNAATFVAASNQYLTRADNAAFQMGTGDFSFSFWFKTTTTTDFQQCISYGVVGAGRDYGVYFKNDGAGVGPKAHIEDAGAGVASDANSAKNDGNWHLLIATYSRAGNLVVTVDNSTYSTKDITGVTGSVNSASGFAIGARPDAANFLSGSIDEVGIWNRVLTAGELTTLWNGGSGVTYPF